MVDGPVAERGVLTAPADVWDAAVRQAEVIGPLAEKARVGLVDADEAAAMLQVSRRQVYVLLIGELAHLLTDAAVAAIESGEEAINQRTLLLAPYAGPSSGVGCSSAS